MANQGKIDVRKLEKSSWEPMRLSHLGKATNLIRSGGGKISLIGGDPGESRKQKAG